MTVDLDALTAVHPDDRPVGRTDLAYVDLDEGAFLYDPDEGTIHRLNDMALLVWASFDGTRSIDELADDFAARTGAPRATIHDDLVQATIDFRRNRLLEGFEDAPAQPGELTFTFGQEYQAKPPTPWPYVSMPSGCGPNLEMLDWPHRFAVQIGERRLGLRTNDVEVGELLQELLAPYVVDDAETPANFSLLVPHPLPGQPADQRQLNLLYHGCRIIGRARGTTRLAGLLDGLLAAHAPSYAPLPRLEATVFVVDGQAIVLNDGVTGSADALEVRLGREDIRRVIGKPPVDVATHTIIVPTLATDGTALALDRVEAIRPTPPRERPPAAPGRYPIRAWIMPHEPLGATGSGDDGILRVIRSLEMPAGHEARKAQAGVDLFGGVELIDASSGAEVAEIVRSLLATR